MENLENLTNVGEPGELGELGELTLRLTSIISEVKFYRTLRQRWIDSRSYRSSSSQSLGTSRGTSTCWTHGSGRVDGVLDDSTRIDSLGLIRSSRQTLDEFVHVIVFLKGLYDLRAFRRGSSLRSLGDTE